MTETSGYATLTSENATVLLVDHQVGLMTGVRDIDVAELKHNVVAMTRAAQLLGVPVITTTTDSSGMWGPTIPELTAVLDQDQIIDRSMVNAWDDERIRQAVGATGATGATKLITPESRSKCARRSRPSLPSETATTPTWLLTRQGRSTRPSARQVYSGCKPPVWWSPTTPHHS